MWFVLPIVLKLMDFTSDLYSKEDLDCVPISQVSEENLSENDDLLRFKLQEEKDLLLEKRSHLLTQLENKTKQLALLNSPTNFEKPIHLELNDDRLLELFVKNKKIPTKESLQTIHGGFELKTELASRYDVLPLLNKKVRYDMLVRCYPNMIINSVNFPVVHLSFRTDTRQVLEIKYKLGIHNEKISELKVISISDINGIEFSKLINYVHETKNISFLLIGCNECSYLLQRRYKLLETLKNQCESSLTNLQELVVLSNGMQLKKSELTVKLRVDIEFEQLPYPNTKILCQVTKESMELAQAQYIMDLLMNEYGVVHGIYEFIKTIFTL